MLRLVVGRHGTEGSRRALARFVIVASSVAAAASGLPASAAADSAYVSNIGGNNISQYDVGAGGALSPKATPTVGTGVTPQGMAISPDGKSLYVVNSSDNTISQYDIGAGGDLTPKSTATVGTGSYPIGIVISPDGHSAYVTNFSDNTISEYDVAVDGTLSPKAQPTVATGHEPEFIAIAPGGSSVYVPNFADNDVSQYDVGAGGALSPKSTPTVSAGHGANDLAISPDGTSLYVLNVTDGTVSMYDIGAGGGLVPKSTPTVATGTRPAEIAFTPDGTSAYVTNFGGSTAPQYNVSQYDVGSGGVLAPKAIATVATGKEPIGIAISADGHSAYVANYGGNTISQYDIGTGGVLAPKSTPTVAGGTEPEEIRLLAAPAKPPPCGIKCGPPSPPPCQFNCGPPPQGCGAKLCLPQPDTTITSGPSGKTSSAPRFTYTSDIPGSTFVCSFDNQPSYSCDPAGTVNYALPYGRHTFQVHAVALGVMDPVGDSRSFDIEPETRDFSCTVDADVAVVNTYTDALCYFYGTCPAYSTCRVTGESIHTADMGRGRGWVWVAACQLPYPGSDLKYCYSSDGPGSVPGTWASCYFPSAAPSPLNIICPWSYTSKPQDPPFQRWGAACQVYQFVDMPGSGRVTCTITAQIIPAFPFVVHGGAGGGAVFVPAAGNLVLNGGAVFPGVDAAREGRSRPPAFAPIRISVRQAGWVQLHPRLSRANKATLLRRHKLTLPLRLMFTPQQGARVVKTQQLTLTLPECHRVTPPKRTHGHPRGKPIAPTIHRCRPTL